MSCLIREPLKRGMTDLYGLPDRRLQTLSTGAAVLTAEDRYGETLNRREGMVVFLHGAVRIRGEGFDYGEVQLRRDPLTEPPHALYCPPGLFAIKALTDSEFIILRRECGKEEKGGPPALVPPAESPVRTEGTGDAALACRLLRGPQTPGTDLVIGETQYAPAASGAPCLGPELAQGPEREGLLFFRMGTPEAVATVRLEGEEEPVEARSNDVVIVPAGTPATVSANGAPVCCIWGFAAVE
jgi:5-deoxy-D-glucuronate isomerase